MRLKFDQFDLWVFCKGASATEPRYLVLHTSQEKADKWFNGGRFWQILGGVVKPEETVQGSIKRVMEKRGLPVQHVWAVEYTYTFFNIRRMDIEIMPVFAAEVPTAGDVSLDWEHSEFGWLTAAECQPLIRFRGLREGLAATRQYVDCTGRSSIVGLSCMNRRRSHAP